MLEVTNLSVSYGGLRALSDVSLSVAEGKFVTVVGPNGAGKSTLFKTISGVVPPTLVRSPSWVRTSFASPPPGALILASLTCPRGGRCSRP